MEGLVAKLERTNGGWIVWARVKGTAEWVALGTAGTIHVAKAHALALQRPPEGAGNAHVCVKDPAGDAMRAARAEYETASKERDVLPKESEAWRKAHVRACAAARRWKSIRAGLVRHNQAEPVRAATPFGRSEAA